MSAAGEEGGTQPGPWAAELVARAVGPPRRTLASAESCTGGLLGATITAVPGASEAYLGGVVAYSDLAKRSLLGVPADLLQRWGAVSEAVAVEMARGARRALGADLGVGITGVAGPGASEGKPAGLVFVAVASPRGASCERLTEDRGRTGNRAAAVAAALRMALAELAQSAFEPGPRDRGRA